MGLDIYAGTLTRYYSHNWKTVVQQWAEKMDIPSTGLPQMESLPMMGRSCPRRRFRRR